MSIHRVRDGLYKVRWREGGHNRSELVHGSKASGVTSKPAIEGHFKTGQRTITLDEPLFYLTGWLFGKASLIQSGILQNLIPVFPFIRRQASFEDQIAPSHSEGDARHNFANHFHQLASRVIGVERRYDFGPCR